MNPLHNSKAIVHKYTMYTWTLYIIAKQLFTNTLHTYMKSTIHTYAKPLHYNDCIHAQNTYTAYIHKTFALHTFAKQLHYIYTQNNCTTYIQ